MKIRIKGNSVRFRLTKSEVEELCNKGMISEKTEFPNTIFTYSIKSERIKQFKIDFIENEIQLSVSKNLLQNWSLNNKVGFYDNFRTETGANIDISLEKDFTCLDDRGEDESDNYPNPKIQKSIDA